MNIEITQPDGELKRETWTFWLHIDIGGGEGKIFLDSYKLEMRDSTRRKKWHTEDQWQRLFNRDNTIHTPPLPEKVKNVARDRFAHKVSQLEIVK